MVSNYPAEVQKVKSKKIISSKEIVYVRAKKKASSFSNQLKRHADRMCPGYDRGGDNDYGCGGDNGCCRDDGCCSY